MTYNTFKYNKDVKIKQKKKHKYAKYRISKKSNLVVLINKFKKATSQFSLKLFYAKSLNWFFFFFFWVCLFLIMVAA